MPRPGILLPLAEHAGVVATRGEAASWPLGEVVVPAGAPGTSVEVHLSRAEGRGWWRPGLHWDDEATVRWAEGERRLARDAVLLPLDPGDGREHRARVVVEVRPRRPCTRAVGVFSAWFLA